MNACRLVVVRHGETEWNLEGRIQGYHADSPLTRTGREQARAVGARLAAEGIDRLVSSDLGRTIDTAAAIAEASGVALERERDLRERSYGAFEGRTFVEIEREYPEHYEKLRLRDPHYATPGGESAAQFAARIVAAMERIAVRSAGERVAVVTHTGVLGMLLRHVHRIPLDAPRTQRAANASCSYFAYGEGGWRLERWCDVTHLPESKPDGG